MDKFTQTCKFSHYLLSPMLMGSQVRKTFLELHGAAWGWKANDWIWKLPSMSSKRRLHLQVYPSVCVLTHPHSHRHPCCHVNQQLVHTGGSSFPPLQVTFLGFASHTSLSDVSSALSHDRVLIWYIKSVMAQHHASADGTVTQRHCWSRWESELISFY